MAVKHPAKFSPSILDVIRDTLSARCVPEDALILDPFSGLGLCQAGVECQGGEK